jgi:hypothetical protein
MTMRADIRFWTAIFLIGICGFSVTRGWSIVHFSLAQLILLQRRLDHRRIGVAVVMFAVIVIELVGHAMTHLFL